MDDIETLSYRFTALTFEERRYLCDKTKNVGNCPYQKGDACTITGHCPYKRADLSIVQEARTPIPVFFE